MVRRKRHTLVTKQASDDGDGGLPPTTRRKRGNSWSGLRALAAPSSFLVLLTICLGWRLFQPKSADHDITSSRDTIMLRSIGARPRHKTEKTVALKQGHELLSREVTIPIKPKKAWLKDPAIAYPVRDVLSSEQICPYDEDFNMWIRKRTERWRKSAYLKEHKIWQDAIG